MDWRGALYNFKPALKAPLGYKNGNSTAASRKQGITLIEKNDRSARHSYA